MSVLFVCLGNICRSPTAEAVFRELCPEVATDSAGTGGWHVGAPPYGPMQHAARARGYEMADLRARQFRPSDFDDFELIIGMDAQNIADIEDLRPVGAQTPVKSLALFGELGHQHVPDPYYTRDFNEALDIVEDAVRGLVRSLRNS